MELRTKRLILRKPKISDWKDLVEGLNDFNTSKYLSSVPYPYKKKDALDWVKKSKKVWLKKEKNKYPFVIELREEKKVIGGIELHGVNKENGLGNTGSWVNKSYRRKGYITEAKIAINDFTFNKLKLRKLETEAFKNNKASNAVQISVGYKYEGCRKKHHISKATGKAQDSNLYGLMKEDWKKVRSKVVKKLEEKIKRLEK